MMVCPNCGAPIEGDVCEYCGCRLADLNRREASAASGAMLGSLHRMELLRHTREEIRRYVDEALREILPAEDNPLGKCRVNVYGVTSFYVPVSMWTESGGDMSMRYLCGLEKLPEEFQNRYYINNAYVSAYSSDGGIECTDAELTRNLAEADRVVPVDLDHADLPHTARANPGLFRWSAYMPFWKVDVIVNGQNFVLILNGWDTNLNRAMQNSLWTIKKGNGLEWLDLQDFLRGVVEIHNNKIKRETKKLNRGCLIFTILFIVILYVICAKVIC